MSFPTPLHDSWQVSSGNPITWDGTGWYYDGSLSDTGGDLDPSTGSTWQNNYFPGALSITFESTESWETYGDLGVTLLSDVGYYSYQVTMPDEIKPSGTYTLNFDLTDGTHLFSGGLGEITGLNVYLGRGDGVNVDRSFTITDITFSGSSTPFEGPFWKDFVGCESS